MKISKKQPCDEVHYKKASDLLTAREKCDLKIITKMYRQQKEHFQNGNRRKSIPYRIVSINKPHLRPTVRGNKSRNVEFTPFLLGESLHLLDFHII